MKNIFYCKSTIQDRQEQRKPKEQIMATHSMPLLDENGFLTLPSYANGDLYEYNKQNIKCGLSRLKEWEFYQVFNDKWCLQATYGHTSYAGNVACTLIEFDKGTRHSVSVLKLFPKGTFDLDFTSGQPHNLHYQDDRISLDIVNVLNERSISVTSNGANKGDARVNVRLTMSNLGDPMCYCMQFDDRMFYYNYKKIFPTVSGDIIVDGVDYPITPDTTAIIDSGRGCWPYCHNWYWGMGQMKLNDGHALGMNIGLGNSDRSDTTENMLFYDGQLQKLGRVTIDADHSDYNKPWLILSQDGNMFAKLTPYYDNYTSTNLLLVHNRCHQVFGKLEGKVKLCDNQVIDLNGMNAFCEYANNRW
ncbi:MAG: DUF2804 domain-containing protein [Clostridia bacterium]|nr:DUF2804 domain-containing protein [Clostridia bacterium]